VKNELFGELLESVHQGGAILRGESEAGRSFQIPETGEHRRLPADDAATPAEHAEES
jgi:hypothetical protein